MLEILGHFILHGINTTRVQNILYVLRLLVYESWKDSCESLVLKSAGVPDRDASSSSRPFAFFSRAFTIELAVFNSFMLFSPSVIVRIIISLSMSFSFKLARCPIALRSFANACACTSCACVIVEYVLNIAAKEPQPNKTQKYQNMISLKPSG